MRPIASGLVACLGVAVLGPAALAQAPNPVEITLTGTFIGKDDDPGNPAEDLSGIACMEPIAGKRRCLIVNDENKAAQFATFDGKELAAGNPPEPLPLIGSDKSDKTLGKPPEKSESTCKADDFEELDGEGVAYSAQGETRYFYVVGSHGCSRKKGKFRQSSFILARVLVDKEGRPVTNGKPALEAVETTYRLSDVLKSVPKLKPHFAKNLKTEQGLNIEGIAVRGEDLFIGLRAPVIDKKAFILKASVKDLFAPGQEPSKVAPGVIEVALDEDIGIRDLASLDKDRLVVLAGPTGEKENVPYRLVLVAAADGKVLQDLARIENNVLKGGKAEGVAVIEAIPQEKPKELRLLVLLEKAKAFEYRVPVD
jgi:hypothetical protein